MPVKVNSIRTTDIKAVVAHYLKTKYGISCIASNNDLIVMDTTYQYKISKEELSRYEYIRKNSNIRQMYNAIDRYLYNTLIQELSYITYPDSNSIVS